MFRFTLIDLNQLMSACCALPLHPIQQTKITLRNVRIQGNLLYFKSVNLRKSFEYTEKPYLKKAQKIGFYKFNYNKCYFAFSTNKNP